jgi:hypothetical protein
VIGQEGVKEGDDRRHPPGNAQRPEHEQHRHRDRGEREDEEDVHRGADAAGDRAEHLEPDQVQVVERYGKVEQLLVERRAEARVGGEPRVVDATLREHLVEGRVGLERIHAGSAAHVRKRNVDVGIPQLEHRHEDYERGHGHEHRVEQQEAAATRPPWPVHGGTVTVSIVAFGSHDASVSDVGERQVDGSQVVGASSPNADQSSGFGSVYSPSTCPSTPSSSTRPRIVGGSSAL